ncbi:MAG: DUF4442 domain-containing protein [Acidobacteriota bacterium]
MATPGSLKPRSLKSSRLRWLMNLYAPLLGAGIRVTHMDLEGGRVDVRLKLSWFNRNYVGTHFGGSLYAMCDPFFVLILARRLGKDYVVWDKEAAIRFRRPAVGVVRARFEIGSEQVEEIRREADLGLAVEPRFVAEVLDSEDRKVVEIDKLLYVRRKDISRERARLSRERRRQQDSPETGDESASSDGSTGSDGSKTSERGRR